MPRGAPAGRNLSYRYLFATGVVDDRLYVIGGQGPANGTQTDEEWDYKGAVQVYDVATDIWSDATSEAEPTASAASCTLGSRIFLFGGETSNRTTIYDAALDSWSEGTPPPLERNGHSCVVVGDLFYLLGGRSTNGGGFDAVETYDPLTDTWAELPGMPDARYWFGATAVNDTVYVVGGSIANGLLDSVWEYTVE
jgi:N-acetylneuraminic acid mutarotase